VPGSADISTLLMKAPKSPYFRSLRATPLAHASRALQRARAGGRVGVAHATRICAIVLN
jgi:hypothetical protein